MDQRTGRWIYISQAFTHDNNGNILTKRDGQGYVTTFTYDLANQTLTVQDPDTKVRGLAYTVRNIYDARGRVTDEFRAGGAHTRLQYNNAGRVTVIWAMLDGALQLMQINEYDSADNLRAQRDGVGSVTLFEYNSLGLVRRVTTPGDATIPSNIIETQYDRAGNVKRVTDLNDMERIYTHDSQGRQTSATVRRRSDHSESITTRTHYDLNGNARFLIDGEGNRTEITYTALNQPQTIRVHGTYHFTTLTYDRSGNVLTERDIRGNIRTFEYDPLNRLIYVRHNGVRLETLYYNNNHVQTASTDALGNTTAFAYDRNNRLMHTIDPLWNASGQIYTAGGLIEIQFDGNSNFTRYMYDELGRLRILRNTNMEITRFEYDLNSNILTTTNAAGHVTTFTYGAQNRLSSRTEHGGNTVVTTFNGETFGVSTKTVEAWESGKNIPSGCANRMLELLEHDYNLLEKYSIMARQ